MSRWREGNCRPPLSFLPAGRVTWAAIAAGAPAFIARARARRVGRGKLGEGIRYEEKAHAYLASLSASYMPGPWLTFTSEISAHRIRFCQPDGLILDFVRGALTLVEIKLKHTQAAWWQTRHLYEPVLRHIFRDWSIAIVEVAKWIDPHTPFPEHYKFASREQLPNLSPGSFSLHLYSTR